MATIVIIEDCPDTRQVVREVLEEQGHDMWEASNGEEGIMLCRLLLPDLVITDIVMPVKDGLATIMDLKETFVDSKVIAMSAHPDKLEVAISLGARDIFLKPFSRQDLCEAVKEALRF